MDKHFYLVFFVVVISALQFVTGIVAAPQNEKPNIVFVLADDLGYHDLSWTDPNVLTPNLEALYREGLQFENYYVQHLCTPSRAALMSGYYPFHLGLQHDVIRPDEPRFLPFNLTTFPYRLRQLGYRTAAVGKWHLGFCQQNALPQQRGFDHFFGQYLGGVDHFTHYREYKGLEGYDLRRGSERVVNEKNHYSTDLYAEEAVKIINDHDVSRPLYLYLPFYAPHSPVQVPDRYVDMNRGRFSHMMRMRKMAMGTAIDEGVGHVISAMKEKGLWNNTIFIFSSDNGGVPVVGAFNYPYRGGKRSVWEGSTRSPAFIYGKNVRKGKFNGLFHIVDWYPTLLHAAGASQSATPSDQKPLDGIDQWKAMMQNRPIRDEFIYNIDEILGSAAVRDERFKLIMGHQEPNDYWYEDMSQVHRLYESKLSRHPATRSFPTLASTPYMLFDLKNDPYEKNDISAQNPAKAEELYAKLARYRGSLVPAKNGPGIPSCNPAFYHNFWAPGWC